MRYLMLLHGTQPPTPPPPELMEAIMSLGEEATRGRRAAGHRGPRAERGGGARVELSGGQLTVTDGPFTEAKEIISYAVYEVRSKEEAVEWATRFLAPAPGPVAGLGGRRRRPPGVRARTALRRRMIGSRDGYRSCRASRRCGGSSRPGSIAGLARLVGDVGLAEELAQDALVAALEQWPADGRAGQPGRAG